MLSVLFMNAISVIRVIHVISIISVIRSIRIIRVFICMVIDTAGATLSIEGIVGREAEQSGTQ
jgi:hypothetical protein